MAGRLGQPLGGAAGGGGEEDAQPLALQHLDDAAHQRRLAGPRAAGHDQHLARQPEPNRLALLGGEGDLLALLEPGEGALDVERQGRRRRGGEGGDALGDLALGGVEGREIDRRRAVRQRLDDRLAGGGERREPRLDPPRLDAEERHGFLQERRPRQEAVAALGRLAQEVEEGGLDPLRRVLRQPQRRGDPVGAAEADAEDLDRQAEGALAHHRHRLLAVALVDLDRQAGGDAVRLQEHHQLLDAALLAEGAPDLAAALPADPRHLGKPLGAGLDDRQGFHAEARDQALGEPLADAAHQPRAEVALDPDDGRGSDGLVGADAELPAVAGVLLPAAGQPQAFAGLHGEEVADRGDQLALVRHRQPHDAPGALGVGEDDPLEDPFEESGVGLGSGRPGQAGLAGLAHQVESGTTSSSWRSLTMLRSG